MKLGLALSGGGFRASLFHLGVLARMAELDLLGKVEVLSCVSGGSIVGAAYYLMLKNMMEANASLTRDAYVALVGKLEGDFLKGVQKNVRMHLLTNLIANVRMAVSDTYSRTDRLASRLNHYFYRDIWKAGLGKKELRAIPLKEIKITPPDYLKYKNLRGYNNAHDYKIPMLVINATTLNTGKNFRFTASEIGDPDLGYIRFDEVRELVSLKPRLAQIRGKIEELKLCDINDLRRLASQEASGARASNQAVSNLLDKKFALVTGDPNRGVWRDLVAPFRSTPGSDSDQELFDLLRKLRVAVQVTDTCENEMAQLTLEKAVAASAAVPGLFTPLTFRDLYDDRVVEVVRLVDGGVYDNQGLTALLEEDCTHIICSDASAQLTSESDPSGKTSVVVGRTNDILMEKVRVDELVRLREAHDTTEDVTMLVSASHPTCPAHTPPRCSVVDKLKAHYQIAQVAFFHLRSRFAKSRIPQPRAEIQEAISKIRTDLDSFTHTEAQALMYDGYYMASSTLIPQWFDAVPAGTQPTPPLNRRWTFYPPPLDRADLLEQLTVASKQLFKIFRLWWTGAGAAAWLVALALFGLAWRWIPDTTLNDILQFPREFFGYTGSVTIGFFVPGADAVAGVPDSLKRILDFPILPLGNLFEFPFHLPAILLTIAVAFVVNQRWGQCKRYLQNHMPRVWSILRWIIVFRRAPLFPIVLFWAIIAWILSWGHLLLFDRLFLRAGRR